MSKDYWKDAPEWAGVVIAAASGAEYYASQWGGISARLLVGSTFVEHDHNADMIPPHNWTLVATRQAPWTGEGFPPVGTVCEHRTGPGMNWSNATVLAYGDNKVFYRDSGDHEWTRLYDEIEFRPIRTPEQIAADERDAAIKEMIHRNDHAGLQDWAEYVYDHLGYRKQSDQ